jgi:hypothetical protein
VRPDYSADSLSLYSTSIINTRKEMKIHTQIYANAREETLDGPSHCWSSGASLSKTTTTTTSKAGVKIKMKINKMLPASQTDSSSFPHFIMKRNPTSNYV